MSDRPVTSAPYDRDKMLQNPDAEFDKLRHLGGLVWSKPLGRWMAISHPIASEALKNRDLRVYDVFASFAHITKRTSVDLTYLADVCSWIPFLHEGSRHAALRAFFARLLTALRAEYLDAMKIASAELLDSMLANGGGDLAHDYAERLHAETLGALAGFTAEERLWLARTSDSQGSVEFPSSVAEMISANDRARQLMSRFKEMIARPAAHGLMERIGHCLRDAGIEDTPGNRLSGLTALTLLGRDTLAGTVTVGMSYLLDAHQGRLGPGSWGDTRRLTDEFLRLSSTVQITMRVASKDTTLGGQRIHQGEVVMVYLPAANHDPDTFACPHAVNSGVTPSHIAFGSGRHLCSGKPLANSVIDIVLAQLSGIRLIEQVPGRMVDTGRITRKFKTLPCRMEN